MAEAGALAAAALLALLALGAALHRARRGASRLRLLEDRAARPVPGAGRGPLIRAHRALAACGGAALGGTAGRLASEIDTYAAALALMGAAVALVLEDVRLERRLLRAEAQLADAIDLLVGALRAGAGLGAALEAAQPRLPQPLRALFEEMSRRLRLGDEPARIFREPAERVDLASFRLFSLALATQWEAGGSLGPALALVGRSVRDRVALSRRVGTESASALGSVAGIAIITHGIAVLMWLWDPAPTEAFMGAAAGALAVSFALALQALGLLWIRALVRIET